MIKKPIRISLWSGPRNVSTAIMYAFAQRPDTRVFDEPLYAHYLSNSNAHAYHPGSEDILKAQNNDGSQVVAQTILADSSAPVLFFKNMAHHLIELDWAFLDPLFNVLLTREPRDMLHSYSKTIGHFSIEDTGYPQLVAIAEHLTARGTPPLVVDSKALLGDPEKGLRKLCEFAGIAFDPIMLSWEKGPKAYDGIWAPHWYHNIHRSTSFKPYTPKTEPFPEALKPLLEECQPYYDRLMKHSA